MAETNSAPARTKEIPREFNPRWKGYLFILVASLVNFSSISNLDVEAKPHFHGMFQASLMFGVVSFILTIAILILDRFQYCCSSETANKYNYTKALDGKMEGYTLLGLTVWWIIGVAHITQVDGIAYVANNIYFSSWFTLAACIYTLDKWSAAKDILSIEELTGLSATLRSWYCLFLASLVTLGTSADLHASVSEDFKSSAAYGIVMGLISSMVSLFLILVHYRLIDYEFLQVGGWMELSFCFSMSLLWVIGVAILTSEGGVAATIGGSGCTARSSSADLEREFGADECYVIWDPIEESIFENQESEAPTPVLEPSTEAPTQNLENETSAPTTLNTTAPSDIPSDSPSVVPTILPTDSPTIQTNTTESVGNLTTSTSPTTMPTTSSSPTIAIDVDSDADTDLVESDNEITLERDDDAPFNLPDADDAVFEGDAEGVDDEDNILNDVVNATSEANTNETMDDLTNFSSNLTREGNERTLQEVQLIGVNLDPSKPFNATTMQNGTFNNNTWTDIPTAMPSTSPTRQPSAIPSAAPSVYFNRMSCIDVLDRQIPGSNLYLASWLCFFAAFNVTLRWKAAQALQFAQAQHRKADERAGLAEDDDLNSDRDNEDGDAVAEDTSYGEEDGNL